MGKKKTTETKGAAKRPKVKAAAGTKQRAAATRKNAKAAKNGKAAKLPLKVSEERAQVLSSETVFEGPLFRVSRDRLIEPGAKEGVRDVIRHNGSVVILAMDKAKNKKDPLVVMERQYRHAANRFLWELPAGKIEEGEDPLEGAKRELEEETGFRAKRWKPMVEYWASPGFLGESMKVYLAEGLAAGQVHPEDDEEIEIRLVKLSGVLKMIDCGAIVDGKTLISVLLYARQERAKRR